MSVLNLATGNGNYLRYTSTIDQWFINKTEIALRAFYLDHGSVKTGWGYINEGMAPDWHSRMLELTHAWSPIMEAR